MPATLVTELAMGRESAVVVNAAFGRQVRLRRLFDKSRRLFVVPLDHSVTDGPAAGITELDPLVSQLSANGVDAVVLHKGSLRFVDHRSFLTTSLIVHLSASTTHAPDPNAKYLVGSVEECVRLGADAVSVHVNLGSTEEANQIADLAAVAGECDRWNMPLLAMVYPRGPKIPDPREPDVVAHATMIAADLGADIVKTVYAGDVAVMSDIVRSCPIPVVVAGGPRRSTPDDLMSYVDDVLAAGAHGVAMGRNIFQAPDPGAVARRVAARIHQDTRHLGLVSRGAGPQPARR